MTHGGQRTGAAACGSGAADCESEPRPASDQVRGLSYPGRDDLTGPSDGALDGGRDAAPRQRDASSKRIAVDKVQITAYVPRDVAEAARDAVVATTPYRNGYRGLSELVTDAVAEKVERLQRQFNSARPFPPRQVDLRPGRRMN